jgi:transcriptional regulator GlxA family with amidase domain
VTLLPTEGVQNVDSPQAVQALLTRIYLERIRRPPASRDDFQSIRLLEPTPPPTSRVPDTVQSAIAFIDTHAAEPIGLTEIASAVQLSPRALQAAFRRHLGTTPLAQLRAVRMARVHADLQSARPGDGQTVSVVANRWGISQLSRFARDYRQRYGVSPRQTLSRSVP